MMTVPLCLHRYRGGQWQAEEDQIAAEEPLEIRVEGKVFSVVMRTPGHDRELVAGLLQSEGIIATAADLFDITTCLQVQPGAEGNIIDVALRDPRTWDRAGPARSGYASSSCGVCGQASIEHLLQQRKPIVSSLRVPASLLLQLPARLAREQAGFQRSGGLHACALFTAQGELLQVREDIGRHNALDKLIGWALLSGYARLRECLVLLSGRVSFEMMQKAQAAELPIVAAISAPSSMAVAMARESGQTLVGFLRGETMNVYAGEERVVAEATAVAVT